MPIALLDLLEQSLGIVTSSVPALTALISRRRKQRQQKKQQQKLQRKPSQSSQAPAKKVHPKDSFDFLAFAYDPDSQNIGSCHAIAYSTSCPDQHGWWSWVGLRRTEYKAGEIRADCDDGIERLAGSRDIAMTTTVSVVVSRI